MVLASELAAIILPRHMTHAKAKSECAACQSSSSSVFPCVSVSDGVLPGWSDDFCCCASSTTPVLSLSSPDVNIHLVQDIMGFRSSLDSATCSKTQWMLQHNDLQMKQLIFQQMGQKYWKKNQLPIWKVSQVDKHGTYIAQTAVMYTYQ